MGAILLGLYFMFAAVQGDYGVFRRGEVLSEKRALEAELLELEIEVTQMENLTRRLSDDYLDLDLLDQQARDVLGLIRTDEIVIR
jgi:cell division protein FtsB